MSGQQNNNNNNDNNPNPLIFKGALAAAFIAAMVYMGGGASGPESERAPQPNGAKPYTDFVTDVERGRVTNVYVQGQNLVYQVDQQSFQTYVPDNENVADVVRGTNTRLTAAPPPQPSMLTSLLPTLLLLGGLFFLYRFMFNRAAGGGAGGVGQFGKSKARLLNQVSGRVTFADVAGIDEAKEELQEIVDFLRDPRKFSRLGGKIPRGALLVGPPGTGKTLTARAVAGEAGVPFFSTSGSEFVEMYVGVGASRVRDMFAEAKKNAPCIIFIDEIDAVGRQRGGGGGPGGGNDERESTLNQLLVEMDGFNENEGVIVLAATNRADILDAALKRPGRFDRQVTVSLPDVKGREKILGVHTRKLPIGPDVDLRVVARGTPGFSGADLANLANEAALMAARRNRRVVTLEDFETAKDKIMMGPERRSLMMTDEQKKLTAYHEGGHAVLSVLQPACDPIHKATIMPRGGALGMVVSLPEGDRVSLTREKAMADLVMTAGGRVAEELIFGEDKVTTGASGDIQQMTRLASAMVKDWGLSKKIGMVRHSPSNQEEVFSQSEASKRLVNAEIKALTDGAHAKATELLTTHIDKLHAVANALLEYETLSGDEVRALVLHGTPVNRKAAAVETQAQTAPSVNDNKQGAATSEPEQKAAADGTGGTPSNGRMPRVPRKPDDNGPAPKPQA